MARPYRPFKFLRQKVAGHLSAGLARAAVGFSCIKSKRPGQVAEVQGYWGLWPCSGFEVGIRPLESLAGSTVFEADPLNRSGTAPQAEILVDPCCKTNAGPAGRQRSHDDGCPALNRDLGLAWRYCVGGITARADEETAIRRGWKARRSAASPAGRCQCPRLLWGAAHAPARRQNRHQRTWPRCRRRPFA